MELDIALGLSHPQNLGIPITRYLELHHGHKGSQLEIHQIKSEFEACETQSNVPLLIKIEIKKLGKKHIKDSEERKREALCLQDTHITSEPHCEIHSSLLISG